MSGRLENKVALITGAARGIGLEFAKSYLSEGACVCIADIDIDRARHEVEKLGERACAAHLDVRDQHSIDTAIDQTVNRFGQIDILVNNAALFPPPHLLKLNGLIFKPFLT